MMTLQSERGRRRAGAEVLLVLGVSLGQSAVYSVLSLVNKLTETASLGDQSTTIHTQLNPKPWLDLLYQLAGIGFGVLPAFLALYLLRDGVRSGADRIGLTWRPPGRTLDGGALLAAAIGVPGLAFFALGRVLGITVDVQAATLGDHWHTVPVLLLGAAEAALLEEVVVVGYLVTRLRAIGWSAWVVIMTSALLRGSYHLYQGIGPFVGNAVMGVVFAWLFTRTRRVAPLVVAHFLLDAVSFLGYPLAAGWLSSL